MKLLITTAIAAAALLQPLQAKPDKKDKKGQQPAPAQTAPQVAAHPQAHPKQMHAQAHPQTHQQSHPKAYAQTDQQIQHSGKSPKTWQNTAVANNGSFQKKNHHGSTVAFGGNTTRTNINSQTYNRTEINYSRPPETVYRDWDRRHEHSWNNHNYRWYGNTWVIIDSGYDRPGYGYYSAPSVAYSSGGLAASVQEALGRRGYDPGYPDGVVGPQTRNAIAAFQEDRGLPVNGRIDQPLLRTLGL